MNLNINRITVVVALAASFAITESRSWAKRPAAEIAAEADRAAKRFIDDNMVLGTSWWYRTKERGRDPNCPLTNPEKVIGQGVINDLLTTTSTAPKVVRPITYTAFDQLFQAFGTCLDVDWRVLKALAHVESGFNPTEVNEHGFTGLFRTKRPFCEVALSRYDLADRCRDVVDPQTNTMVGAVQVRTSLELINQHCGRQIRRGDTEGLERLLYFISLGHHSGHGTLKSVLETTKCDHTRAKEVAAAAWRARGH